MAEQENTNPQQGQGQKPGFKPNVVPGGQNQYKPKREANQQNRNESTGLSEAEDQADESDLDVGSTDASDDDSGAI